MHIHIEARRDTELMVTWERPLAPWGTPLTQSPAMKMFPKEVVCSGRDAYEPGLKCVTAFGNRSTALSITFKHMHASPGFLQISSGIQSLLGMLMVNDPSACRC